MIRNNPSLPPLGPAPLRITVATMNYDLAMMALDGLARAPLTIETQEGTVVIKGVAASFKELARLCLLMGSADAAADDSFELQPGRHVSASSPMVTLRLV